MTTFNDKIFIGAFIVITTFLGQYLFSKSKSQYGYNPAIYFGQKKMKSIK